MAANWTVTAAGGDVIRLHNGTKYITIQNGETSLSETVRVFLYFLYIYCEI